MFARQSRTGTGRSPAGQIRTVQGVGTIQPCALARTETSMMGPRTALMMLMRRMTTLQLVAGDARRGPVCTPQRGKFFRMATVAVLGGGLVGLASAYKLQLDGRFDRVVLLEKEREVAMHQSTHNSGVLHAGLYYAPGSLKARLAVAGLREMVAFCREHGIAHEQCGKVVVATDESELERLSTLFDRGQKNGLQRLRRIDAKEIREIEPHANGIAAVHVPEEGIADYAGVTQAMKRLITAKGGEVLLNAPVRSLRRLGSGWEGTAGSERVTVSRIVNCAGLHADRVARLAGEATDIRIVPFRGEYYTLRPDRAFLVRNLIYPVPNPAFPFLGVHLTRLIHGGIEAGPNAVLATSREGY